MSAIRAGMRWHLKTIGGGCVQALVVIGLLGLANSAEGGEGNAIGTPGGSLKQWAATYARLPMSFEPNRGQTDQRVKFLARGQGYTLFLTPHEAVLTLHPNAPSGEALPAAPPAALRLKLRGANPAVDLTGEERLPGESNYFLGKDPRRWQTHLPTYAQVRYHHLYPGVDLVYYGHQGQLECDFVVAPGADPRRIALSLEGAERRWVDGQGDLVLAIGGSEVRWRRPRVYQHSVRGEEREIAAHYVPGAGDRVRLAVARYDRSRPLIIDPVLSYSTYLGGTGGDVAYGIAVDASGNAYVTGTTNSTNFPTSNPAQSASASNGDAFVTKLNTTGTALVYSTFLGGSGVDTATAIAVDTSGDAYVTGSTTSTDFPVFPTTTTPPAFQTVYGGGSTDAFVVRLTSTGSALDYSTYLGGSGADFGYAIAADGSRNAYVTGSTDSPNFPTASPFQAGSGGASDVFVTKLDFTGTVLVYSTYLGGTAADVGQGIKVDGAGNAWIVGSTFSTDFPTLNPLFGSNASPGQADAFVSEVNPAGSGLLFSTYLGGSGDDRGTGIALDTSGNIYVTGSTLSTNFPTTSGVYQTTPRGSSDVFVTKLNATGPTLAYSTLLGGTGVDQATGIAADSSGDAFVAVATLSTNFPAIAGAYQGYLTGVAGVAFVAKIDPTTNAPGVAIVPQKVDFGNQTEGVRSALKTVTVIDAGTAPLTITGIASSSTDFTETDNCVGTIAATGGTCTINIAFTPSVLSAESESITLTDSAGNTYTITVTGTGVTEATAVTLSPTSLTFANQNVGSVSAAQTVTITNTGSAALTITQIATSGDFTQTNTCGATLNVLNVGQSCTVSVIFTPTASGARTGSLTVSDNAVGSPQAAALTGTGLAVFSLSSTSPTTTALIGSTGATFTVSTSAPQGFTGSISFSCSSNATCAFSPSPVFPGQSTTLTMSDLSTSTPNPLNFTVNGISGSQTATLSLTVLFADFSLSATPPLNNIISGDPADYTVLVTPANGFNQQVNLSCSNLPIAATCSFASGSVTPNGSPANVGLRINTVKYITSRAPWWRPRGPGSRPLLPWVVCWGLLSMLLALARRRGIQGGNLPPVLVSSRLIFLSLLLSLLALVGSCRSPSAATGGTIPGNYTITITGTLNSNTSVTRSFTVNLSVNAPVT